MPQLRKYCCSSSTVSGVTVYLSSLSRQPTGAKKHLLTVPFYNLPRNPAPGLKRHGKGINA